jgi:hypothetical protein
VLYQVAFSFAATELSLNARQPKLAKIEKMQERFRVCLTAEAAEA